MMKLKLDLHIHSQASFDGIMSLDEIVAQAKACGLNGVAVCDHDKVLSHHSEYEDFLVIPATEVSTQFGHLLGLFVTEEVGTRDFFQAAERIHAQDGLTVLAHPFEHSKNEDRLLPILSSLDGIEVWNGRANRNNRSANQMAQELAQRHGLRPFAGSDAHVPQEIGNGVVTVEVPEATLAAVKSALLGGTVSISGIQGKSACVARSQLTKLKKNHAGVGAYAKWMLFAVKCAAQDLIN